MKKGFTLIELLVVIAIISLLASIISASLGGARTKAAMAKNEAQGNEIKKSVAIGYESLMATDLPADFTNTAQNIPLAQKAEIANVMFPSTVGLDDTPGTGEEGGDTTELGDALPKVPRPIATPEDDDGYYYFSNGEMACMDAEFSPGNCTPLRCGADGETDSSYTPDPYVIAYKLEQSPDSFFFEDIVGYDSTKQLQGYSSFTYPDVGGAWGALTWADFSGGPPFSSGLWQCI